MFSILFGSKRLHNHKSNGNIENDNIMVKNTRAKITENSVQAVHYQFINSLISISISQSVLNVIQVLQDSIMANRLSGSDKSLDACIEDLFGL